MQTPSATPRAAAGPLVFSTEELPPRQRLEAWNARFGTVNRIAVRTVDAAAITTRNENWLLGPILLSRSRTCPARFERSRELARRDGLDHWVLRILRRGRNDLTVGGQSLRLLPGDAALMRMDREWISDWDDSAWTSLCIPADVWPDLSAGLATLGQGRVPIGTAGFLGDYLTMVETHLATAPPEAVPAIAETTRAMIAACLLGDESARREGDVAVAGFERARAVIRRNIASPTLDARRVARLLGMSRSALYRLFEPHGGVARFIQTLRLATAHAMLCDPALAGHPIATIAERIGFFDASTFSRAFRSHFGYTPREARSAIQAGRTPPMPRPAGAVPEAADFGVLLRRLGAAAPGAQSGRTGMG